MENRTLLADAILQYITKYEYNKLCKFYRFIRKHEYMLDFSNEYRDTVDWPKSDSVVINGKTYRLDEEELFRARTIEKLCYYQSEYRNYVKRLSNKVTDHTKREKLTVLLNRFLLT